MIQNKIIQSLIARTISDNSFTGNLVPENHQIDEEIKTGIKKSIREIKKFSAFVCMVQHNFLWNSYFLTRRYLIKFNMELDVFMAYLPVHQRNKAAHINDVDQKLSSFTKFLQNYLSPASNQQKVIVFNALKYEDAIRMIGDISNNRDKPPKTGRRLAPGFKKIIVNPCSKVITLNYSPVELSNMLNSAITQSQRRRYYKTFCIWLDDETQNIRICKISKGIRGILEYLENKGDGSDLPEKKEARTIVKQLLSMNILRLA